MAPIGPFWPLLEEIVESDFRSYLNWIHSSQPDFTESSEITLLYKAVSRMLQNACDCSASEIAQTETLVAILEDIFARFQTVLNDSDILFSILQVV